MLLTFSKQQFVERILAGTKIHTIRTDVKNRWKKGRTIQMWHHNPRNVKLNPQYFANSICTKVEDITIDFSKETVTHGAKTIIKFDDLDQFALLDGFDNWDEMKEWFFDQGFNYSFEGKIIYFEMPCTRLT